MSSDNASARPWVAKQEAWCGLTIYSNDGKYIGTVPAEDANLIVKAVNMHGDLIHALERVATEMPLTVFHYDYIKQLLERAKQ